MEKGKLKYVVWDYTRLVQVFEVGLSSLPTLTPGCLEHLWSHDDDDEDLGLLQPALSANSATTSRGPPFFSEHHRRARDTHNSVGCQANKQSRLYLCQFKTAINLSQCAELFDQPVRLRDYCRMIVCSVCPIQPVDTEQLQSYCA